ncbi:MAG: response regulator transcription factor [Bdellovibrionales bacterium]|nr:response regulator transcription factor [Bdellovibrionales bacterium]
MTRLLLVEDDHQIAKALGINLGLSGYSVSVAHTVADALSKVANEEFQVFLLDINLPDGNGIDLCHEIRALGNEKPVLFLSAKTDEETVVKAMNIGAEDYIRKPFGVEELKARIARALRAQPLPRNIVKAGPITMDLARRQVLINGEILNLSRREFDILTILAQKIWRRHNS